MKKSTLFTILLAFVVVAVQGQEDEKSGTIEKMEYNNWSIDVGFGSNKPLRNFSPNAQSEWFENYSASLGARYMINDKFGLRAAAGYYEVMSSNDLYDFENNFFTLTGEGVANLGAILGFRDWTQRINLLAHAGLGYGQNNFENAAISNDGKDGSMHMVVGLTPQIRLSDRFALNLDVSYYGNVRQDWKWDGYQRNYGNGFDGSMVNASVGLSVYLGSDEKHADWVNDSSEKRVADKVSSLQNKLDKIEKDLQDEDKDGIPNYLDREPNTAAGLAVNSKGQSIDTNNNGVPDEIEEYMKAYPESTVNLTGYADEIGDEAYNQQLSESRAKRVHEILVASRIDSSRIEYSGAGVDASVDKSSGSARQIVRRVTFELK